MSTQTTNLHLVKPADGEAADIGVINGNMDTIDSAVGTLQQSVNQLIRVERVDATILANNGYVVVSAPAVSGYNFMAWIECVSQGWQGLVYPNDCLNSNALMWSSGTSTAARNIRCYALYVKSS